MALLGTLHLLCASGRSSRRPVVVSLRGSGLLAARQADSNLPSARRCLLVRHWRGISTNDESDVCASSLRDLLDVYVSKCERL